MHNYQNFLVPTDFSPQCSNAAQKAKVLAEILDGSITLIHVINYLPPNYISVELPREYASKEFMLEKAKERMDEWAAENGLSDCKKVIETGQPKHVIIEQAEKAETDLIVLAPNMESKFIRFFGSVTNAVAQSTKCDVLVVRTPLS